MKTILTVKEQDINPKSPVLENTGFYHRRAARAVVVNEQGEIALLKVRRYDYHKLPGGGVEEDEDIKTALARELLEEIGCEANIVAEIGEVTEYRDEWQLKQTSYCYFALQEGGQQKPMFTDEEVEEGFEIVWAGSVDDAIELLRNDKPKNYDGKFIQRRDTAILVAGRQFVKRGV